MQHIRIQVDDTRKEIFLTSLIDVVNHDSTSQLSVSHSEDIFDIVDGLPSVGYCIFDERPSPSETSIKVRDIPNPGTHLTDIKGFPRSYSRKHVISQS